MTDGVPYLTKDEAAELELILSVSAGLYEPAPGRNYAAVMHRGLVILTEGIPSPTPVGVAALIRHRNANNS